MNQIFATIEAPAIDSPTSAASSLPESNRHLGALSNIYRYLVALPVVLLAVFAFAFWHFVSFALLSNPALNGLIFLVMAWGSGTMFLHVWRVHLEDQVFRAGMVWLRDGSGGNEQDPKYGKPAHVTGMLDRLSKLGLGHQVYIHSSAMEPELEDLTGYFERKQELSQYLVGLMVALGLLGTFVGLLETLVQTSSLIGTIAKSTGSGGGNMEEEFAKIVGGLEGPLSAMGTAFSASMFGLIGSITLGFQMVVVRKTAAEFVERVRSEVLSLAERTKVSMHVEISERFLSTLLADILQQHKETTGMLNLAVRQMAELVPAVKAAAVTSAELALRVASQENVLERTSQTVGSVAQLVPVLGSLATTSHGILDQAKDSRERLEKMLAFMPRQEALLTAVDAAMGRVETLAVEVASLRKGTQSLHEVVRDQSTVIRRLDNTLWNTEKEALLKAAEPPADGPQPPAGLPPRRKA